MRRATRLLFLATAGSVVLAGGLVCVQALAAEAHIRSAGAARTYYRGNSGYFHGSRGYYRGSYGYGYGFAGYGYSPVYNQPAAAPPYPYMPNYWWVSPYQTADPRQSGYNPNSGYAWGTVTTLMLTTYPVNSKVTLDGVMVGEANQLGPIQLPFGRHTLRVDAPGYEASETVLDVQTPTTQQLAVNLKQADFQPKPAPKN